MLHNPETFRYRILEKVFVEYIVLPPPPAHTHTLHISKIVVMANSISISGSGNNDMNIVLIKVDKPDIIHELLNCLIVVL